MNGKGHQHVHNWLQHGTRLAKDPIPVVTLEDLYLYSLSYMQYSSSSRFVKNTIDAAESYLWDELLSGMENSLAFCGWKEEEWRAIVLLVWRRSHNVRAGGTGDGEEDFPFSSCSRRRKRLENRYFMVMDLLRCCHIDVNTTWTHATL